MESKKNKSNGKNADPKPVLTPNQFLAQKFSGRGIQVPKAEFADLILEYMNYRAERSQNKSNRYAESIGVLKALVALLDAGHDEAAALVLTNSGFSSQDLYPRLEQVMDFEKYKTPKKITSFIRQTLDPDETHRPFEPVKNTENGYVVFNGFACPSVIMDKDNSVLCPFCNERHTHKFRDKAVPGSKLPAAHYTLPCMSKHSQPLEMFDGTICRTKNGYYIENYDKMKSKASSKK